MPVNDELGKRMKTYYEEVPKTRLMRRCPVIIRIDGRSFHSYCKGFKKPFDEVLIRSMQDTMMYLCKNIQGCVLGYSQSDEISLLLIDYKRLNSQAFFDYEIQKVCSITASMATLAFNRAFDEHYSRVHPDFNFYEDKFDFAEAEEYGYNPRTPEGMEEIKKYSDAYQKVSCWMIDGGAMFDSRCFNIPIEEVTNYFYWRQLDATRNSIQMVGQANFSQKELHCKTCNQIQDMLHEQKDINWNDFPAYLKRGSCCIKKDFQRIDDNSKPFRPQWVIDRDIPIFKDEGRDYIERLL